jgi:hypothetical protein
LGSIPSRRRPTIEDVARLAGVSKGAVSIALSLVALVEGKSLPALTLAPVIFVERSSTSTPRTR